MVTGIAVWVASTLAERARYEAIDAKRAAASMMVKVFAASLRAPLDFGDEEDIRSNLEDLSQNAQVLYAAVWRAGSDVALAELGPRPPSPAPPLRAESRVVGDTLEFVERVDDPMSRRLGTVVVGFTLRPELARYANTRHRMLIGAGLLTMIVCAGLLSLLRRRGFAHAGSTRPSPSGSKPNQTALLPSGFSQPPDAAAQTPRPGEVLGQYQLLTCVGQGGMGRVWAARRVGSQFQRLVAVKTTLNGDHGIPEQRHLFIDEARIALLIRHPNVCGVHELGEHEGTLYQVMDWCDGASLRQVLDRLSGARMDFALAVRILARVGAGLHAAHELEGDDGIPLSVVHRDVSPANILISTNGQVKVADFGVAKSHGQLHRPTETGEVKGKISYMAPEQVMGLEVDRRADIFALGCVLYEATTGFSPFGGEGTLSTMYQLVSQAVVSPRARLSDYPEELAVIVLKALEKEPSARYATAEELSVALESWLSARASSVTDQTIAEMLAQSCGALVGEKASRVAQAISLLSPSPPFDQGVPDLAAAPPRRADSQRVALSAREAAFHDARLGATVPPPTRRARPQ